MAWSRPAACRKGERVRRGGPELLTTCAGKLKTAKGDASRAERLEFVETAQAREENAL
jgi:hypothetical protein